MLMVYELCYNFMVKFICCGFLNFVLVIRWVEFLVYRLFLGINNVGYKVKLINIFVSNLRIVLFYIDYNKMVFN